MKRSKKIAVYFASTVGKRRTISSGVTSFSTTITDTNVAAVVDAVAIVVAVVIAVVVAVVVARMVSVVILASAIAGTRKSKVKGSNMFSEETDNFSLGVDNKKSRCRGRERFGLGSFKFQVNAEFVNHLLDLTFCSSARDNILSPSCMNGKSFYFDDICKRCYGGATT